MNKKELKIANFDPLSFFLKCVALHPDTVFLYTGETHPHHDWSILAFGSDEIITDVDKLKKRFLQTSAVRDKVLPFLGGAIGYLSYDLGLKRAGIRSMKTRDSEMPDLFFRVYQNAVLYRHSTRKTYIVFSDETFEQKVLDIARQNPVIPKQAEKMFFRPTADRAWYDKAFQKVMRHIIDGDVYELNLTQNLEADFTGSGSDLFYHLAKKNPAPMSAYLSGDNFEIISCSPERFLQLREKKLETFPIKGTVSRGKDAASDAANEHTLLVSEKEQAELNMVTDLLRNDLGMVSELGSVRVEARRETMVLPSVIHTYSHITSRIRPDMSPFDAFLAMFPGGSITGCPKKRAMEIIDEIELMPRKVYTGCVGYLSFCGNMDFSIAIRTLVREGSRLTLGVGGGIVADSSVDCEYDETIAKARAFTEF